MRGTDLVLTIDQSLQYEVERVLAEEVTNTLATGGTAILADVQTGDVLAMATVDGATADAPAHAAPGTSPNRPLTDVFEPGSTNKVVTIAAALEAGLVSPSTVLSVPGSLVVDGQEYEDVDAHPSEMTVADIVRLVVERRHDPDRAGRSARTGSTRRCEASASARRPGSTSPARQRASSSRRPVQRDEPGVDADRQRHRGDRDADARRVRHARERRRARARRA